MCDDSGAKGAMRVFIHEGSEDAHNCINMDTRLSPPRDMTSVEYAGTARGGQRYNRAGRQVV